jgi:hypothetical protein
MCFVVLTDNSQRKSIQIDKNTSIFCHFIDFVSELTVKTTEHTVARYESSDFTCKFLTGWGKRSPFAD